MRPVDSAIARLSRKSRQLNRGTFLIRQKPISGRPHRLRMMPTMRGLCGLLAALTASTPRAKPLPFDLFAVINGCVGSSPAFGVTHNKIAHHMGHT